MGGKVQLDPDRSLWHLIAVELRRQRELAGLSGSALAGLLDCDRSTVSRLETGMHHLSLKHAQRLDRLWRLDALFTRLVGFATDRSDGDWFVGLRDLERRASRLRMWESAIIPGLLQTEDYARAVLTAGVLAEPVDVALATRLERQRLVFEDGSVPQVSAVLNWPIMHHQVGPSAVMRAQLERLIELSERPEISIRIVPPVAGAHSGMDGAFMLLTVDGFDVAYEDVGTRGFLMRDPAEVGHVSSRWERVSEVALPVGPSRDYIGKRVAEFGR